MKQYIDMKINNKQKCIRQKSIFRNKVELERHRRILISIYAYAYEFENDSLVSDSEFDDLALDINETIKTGNRKLDNFFRNKFDPFTGIWIREHPELDKIKSLYETYYEF